MTKPTVMKRERLAERACFYCTKPLQSDGGVAVGVVSPGRQRATTRVLHRMCFAGFVLAGGVRPFDERAYKVSRFRTLR